MKCGMTLYLEYHAKCCMQCIITQDGIIDKAKNRRDAVDSGLQQYYSLWSYMQALTFCYQYNLLNEHTQIVFNILSLYKINWLKNMDISEMKKPLHLKYIFH